MKQVYGDRDILIINIYVEVDKEQLTNDLIDGGYIAGKRDLLKSVGKPKLMVIDKNMDCARFPDGSSCQLRKQMQEFDAEMEKYFVQIDDVLKMTIDAGCMQPTKLTVDSSSESSSTSSQDTNKDTSSSRNYQDSRYYFYDSYSTNNDNSSYKSNSSSASKTNFNAERIEASSNCVSFMNKIETYESFVWRNFYQKIAVENKYNAMMQELMSSATSNRVNEWLVEQQWDVVDNQAYSKCKSSSQCHDER